MLEFTATWPLKVCGLGLLAIGVMAAGLAIHEAIVTPIVFSNTTGVVLWSFVLLVFVFALSTCGLYVMTARTRFDKQSMEMTHRWLFGVRKTLSLDKLLAVQCVFGQRVYGRNGRFDVYQMNLIWKVPHLQREAIHIESKAKLVRMKAAELANFLGLHLVDQIDASEAYYWQTHPSENR